MGDLYSMAEVVDEYGAEIIARANHITERYGISTGWKATDDLLRGGGLLPGLTYIVAGRPGMGKTTFMQSMATNVAKQGFPAAIFSLELTRSRLLERLAYQECGIDYMDQWRRKESLTPEQVESVSMTLDYLAGLPLYVRDTAGTTPADITATMHNYAEAFDLRVMFIDYLHIMRNSERVYGGGREREIGTMVEQIRDVAKSLNVACVLACQLNRQVEENRPFIPSLSHLRDSGSIEQVAYAVLALYRQDYYALNGMLVDDDGHPPALNHQLQVNVLKQQDGPMGTAVLKFQDGTGRITDQ